MVRRLVGYDRYSSKGAFAQMEQLYRLVAVYTNFFQPVMQLKHKSRHGARVHKVYDEARTPYQRLLAHNVLSPHHKTSLDQRYQRLNPMALRRQIDQALEKLWALADPVPQHQPSVTSILTQHGGSLLAR